MTSIIYYYLNKNIQKLVKINDKISVLEGDNEEIERVLSNSDVSSYMEQVALEEQGYAYPDERRFYDTSRD